MKYMIRNAEPADRDDVSRLHVMAGPNVFRYFFACSEEKAVAVNSLLYDTPDTFCSGRLFHVHASPPGVQGAIGMYPASDNEALGKNIGKYVRGLAGVIGPLSMLLMGPRSMLVNRFPRLGKDELYIEALAVYPEFRSRGVSSALLKFAFEECAHRGLARVSLFAEINNEKAISIYRAKGFRVEQTVELPRRFLKHKLYGFHKMVAPAGAGSRL